MNESSAERGVRPFPTGEPGETAQPPPDPLALDWSEGLRAPLRENALAKPKRLGLQSAAAVIPATTTLAAAGAAAGPGAAESSAVMTEQLDLSALEQLRLLEPVKEAAAEVEAPEAWASAEEDQLASVPPPPKEEVLLLSDAELTPDGDGATEVPLAQTTTVAPGEAETAAAPLLELQASDREPEDLVVSELEAALAAMADGADPEELGILPASAHAPSHALSHPPSTAEPAPDSAHVAEPIAPLAAGATGAADPARDEPLAEIEPEPALRGTSPIGPLAGGAPHDDELHDLLAQLGAHTPSKPSAASAQVAPAVPVHEGPLHAHEELLPAQLLDPHESADWDAAGLEVPEAIAFESTPGYPLPAKPSRTTDHAQAKATHIDALDAHAAIDPWPAPAHEERHSTEAQAWGSDAGSDGIDWAPALAKSPWDAPAGSHVPESAAASADWSDGASDWSAQTAHASPAELSGHAQAKADAAWDSPDADWTKSSAHLTESAPGKGSQARSDDSPFAPLAPGASLSGDDPNELPVAHALAESHPGMLESLDDQDLLTPLDELPAQVSLALPGEHRVAVQTRGGQARRGILRDPDLAASKLILYSSTGQTGPEVIQLADVKAVFFMLAPGEGSHRGDGAQVRVTFVDGRTLEGERDGAEAPEGFFLVPIDAARTNTKRIFVVRGALRDIDDP
jgi:hypothetical protein